MHRFRSILSALKPTRLGILFAVLIGLGVGFWQWGQPPEPRVVLENLGNGHTQRAHPVYFSPDGGILATFHQEGHGAPDFLLTLWDVATGKKKLDLFKGYEPWGLVFSPNGRTLACGFSNQIRVFDLPSGQEVETYHWPKHHQFAFSSDGKLRALSHDFILWDVSDHKFVKKFAKEGEIQIAGGAPDGDPEILLLGKGEIVSIWDLATATLLAERRDIPYLGKNGIPLAQMAMMPQVKITPNRRFLIYQSGSDFIYDLVTGQKKELGELGIIIKGVDLAPDGQMLALEIIGARKQSMWSWLTELMENQADSTETYVSLNRFPSGKELTILRDCSGPVFSPDGKTLAVSGTDGSLHLWDLPIRKPIGKILGLAGLAAVATLLAFNALGWLRRRRMRLEANLAPNSVPSTK